MNDTLCLLDAFDLVRQRLSTPGVLRGRQRSPAFRMKVLRAAKFIIVRHARAVREMARLGADHRIPFARRAVDRLTGVASWAIARCIPILEKIGLLTERSALARWCSGNHRSITPGAKSYWYRPSLFSVGADFAAVLAGTAVAASPLANQCAPDIIPDVHEEVEDVAIVRQPLEESHKNQPSAVRRALNSPAEGEDVVIPAVEGALENYRTTVVPSAMPDDRRPAPPGADAILEALAEYARNWTVEPLSADASRIMQRRRW